MDRRHALSLMGGLVGAGVAGLVAPARAADGPVIEWNTHMFSANTAKFPFHPQAVYKPDAEKLPGFVLPRGALGADGRAEKARIGDIAILYNVHTAKWAFAVVNDAGPAKDFGEGSLALNRILRVGYKASPPRPTNYSETKSLHIANHVAILLFPGTKAGFGGNYAPISVAKAAKKAFEQWGGGDLGQARKRFRECLAVLPESFKGQY